MNTTIFPFIQTSPLWAGFVLLVITAALRGDKWSSASLAESVSRDDAGAAPGAEARSAPGNRRRHPRPPVRLLYRRPQPQEGVLALESEQHHGGDHADQRQPAGSRVQETLALYALAARVEYRHGVAA